MSDKGWIGKRAKATGPPNRKVRFEIAARALSQARNRNSPPDLGGCGCPVLIEGMNDEAALRALGFSGPVELVNRGWDLSRLIAYLYETYGSTNSVDDGAAIILLMDWDRTGGRLQRELTRRLESFDVSVDSRTRMELVRSFKPEGRTVESLGAHAEELCAVMDHNNTFVN